MRLGEKIWFVKRHITDGIVTYDDPVEYTTRFNFINVQPARVALNNMSGFLTTEDFGEHNAMGWNVIVNEKIFKGVFDEGDLMYLDGKTPSDGNANGIITSVRIQNIGIFITVKNLEGE
jgi:hypothetical protein